MATAPRRAPLAPLRGALLVLAASPGLARAVHSALHAPPQDDPSVPDVEIVLPDDPAARPLLASDGEPVIPGRIPSDTPEAARALWERVLAWTRTDEAAAPVRSFDLGFDVVFRADDRHNQFPARYAFVDEPGWLRCDVERSKRVQVRGPKGDWLIEKGQATRLVGRENAQSRREMDQWVAISRNFISLTDPDKVRLVRLALGQAPPAHVLPSRDIPVAPGLQWLEVESPDFRLYESAETGVADPVYRARLGVEPATGSVRLALLEERGVPGGLSSAALLVAIEGWRTVADRRLPENLVVHALDPERVPSGFEERPSVDLWLLREEPRINPELPASYFEP